ncbi:hypothetical protein RCL_jg4009.t1 [Rhizophagus clarus]|uniref:Uncharacterized protein n=1 Tax=Rhizophagus clarus TaxID=94130 RepID=A0A8H3QC52_9GLOM|nr:hypothetical protein RCL_jg4009.t1 [Rhizophagus clarus]
MLPSGCHLGLDLQIPINKSEEDSEQVTSGPSSANFTFTRVKSSEDKAKNIYIRGIKIDIGAFFDENELNRKDEIRSFLPIIVFEVIL